MRASLVEADVDVWRRRFLETGDADDLPIVDAHHHFWDVERNYHPWLSDLPRIPFRYGDYASICKNFMPADYDAARGRHRVVASVMMEGEWDAHDPVGEARWASALRAVCGRPNAMAAQIWLDRDDVAEVLDAYRDLPLVRSVRHKPVSVPRERHDANFAAPGSMRCARWRAGYARLAAAGLMFELQTPWWHFREAAELARDFPLTTIVVNHTGLPSDRSIEALSAWREAMRMLAACPNVHLKISGLGEMHAAWTAERNAAIVNTAIDIFGVQRCLFASNFPVDRLVVGLSELFDGFKAIVASRPREARLALFCDNAIALYRL